MKDMSVNKTTDLMPTTRVAIYGRVSTSTKGQSTDNQVEVLEEYCKRMGYEVYKVYTDEVSGSTSNRPAFNELFEDANKGYFNLVLFWALDRFSREGVSQTIKQLELLESYKVNYKSYTEQYLDSCGIFKDVVISLLSTMAKQERIRMSERVKAGLKRTDKKLGRPTLSVEIQCQIEELSIKGLSQRKIAKRVGISHTAVGKVLKGAA